MVSGFDSMSCGRAEKLGRNSFSALLVTGWLDTSRCQGIKKIFFASLCLGLPAPQWAFIERIFFFLLVMLSHKRSVFGKKDGVEATKPW